LKEEMPMHTAELLNEYKSVKLLRLRYGLWYEEEVSETEGRIGEFIAHLEKYLLRHKWHAKEKGEKSRVYVCKGNPNTYLKLRYGITYPDTRIFYRVDLKLQRRRLLFDKVLAEGEMVFSRI
jgi:hypothetical protein